MPCQLCILEPIPGLKRWATGIDWLYCIECKTCHTPMFVHAQHKEAFSENEKLLIEQLAEEMFGPGTKLRWKMRQILDHAHCHTI